MDISPLQKARYEYQPKLPGMLRNGIAEISVQEGAATQSVADQDKIKALFPNTYGKPEITFVKGANTSEAKKQVVGVILSGGQAPGGHNVISGLYDALKATNPENKLLGFKKGPDGLLKNDYVEFDDKFIDAYRNTGGFDIIGSGRTKLETVEQFQTVANFAKENGLTAIVIIGGDDSNTNAATLAEYMAANNTGIQVIGCPKTIDGYLKNEDIEASFGFDTATKKRSTGTSSRLWDVPLPTLLLSAHLRHSLTSASSVRKLQLRRCLLQTSQTRSLIPLRREQLTATTSVLPSSLRVS